MEINNELNELFLIEMSKLFGLSQDMTASTSTTSSTYTTTSLTTKQLQDTIDKIKLMEKPKNLYDEFLKLDLETFQPQSNDHEFDDKFRFNAYYSPMIKVPTTTICVEVQKRKHKNKRINKKWAKRYGYIEIKKEVPSYGFVSVNGC